MTDRHAPRTLSLVMLTLFALAFSLEPLTVSAQTDAPQVSQTAEYNIGFACPVTATLSPDQTNLWVLMDNCFGRGFTLQGFNAADGTPVKGDDKNFADALAPLNDKWIYPDTKPLAFTPDGGIDLRYNDADTYDALNLRLTLTGEEPAANELTSLTNDTIQKLIPEFAGYSENIIYSTDHTLAVIPDTSAFHIIDLKTGKELFQFEGQPTTDYSRASFSSDNQHLYISTLKNGDDVQDNSSTLNIYNLADGKLLKTYDVPSYFNIFSPDERYIVAQVGGQFDAGFIVTSLETGVTSQTILVNEPPHPVTECLNTGKKLKGLDYKTRGELPVRDIIWLPDSSNFFTVNSYIGDMSGSRGNLCIFNYSRLRQYKVE